MTYLSLNRLSYIFTAKDGASIIFTHNKTRNSRTHAPTVPIRHLCFHFAPWTALNPLCFKMASSSSKKSIGACCPTHSDSNGPRMTMTIKIQLNFPWANTENAKIYSGRLRESTKREKKGSKLHYYFLEDNSLHAISKLCISVVSCCSSWASRYIQRRETISIHTSRDRLQEVKSNWK